MEAARRGPCLIPRQRAPTCGGASYRIDDGDGVEVCSSCVTRSPWPATDGPLPDPRPVYVIPWRDTGEATELRTVARERAVRVRAGGEAGWVRLDEVVGIAKREETPREMPLPDAPQPHGAKRAQCATGGTMTLADVKRHLREH